MEGPPSEVEIGPYTYRIDRSEQAQTLLEATDDYGRFEQKELLIRVQSKLHPLMERETVLHEVLHGVTEVSGLGEELNSDDDKLEEKVVRRMATILLDTLRRNPELTDYLMEEEESHE